MTELQTSEKTGRSRSALGRGLQSLIPSINKESEKERFRLLELDHLMPRQDQPRKVFDAQGLSELADSIREHGILQPLLVRPGADKTYEIIAGERRFRAAQQAGVTQVPCVITEIPEQAVLAVALVENIQREDLNPIEEAEAYRRLLEDMHWTQEEISKAVGKERTTIANALRILKLPPLVRQMLLDKQLTMGHAKALLMLSDAERIAEVATLAFKEGWSVRRIEALASQTNQKQKRISSATPSSTASIELEIRRRLEQRLATRVEVKHQNGKGSIVVHFSDLEQLHAVLNRLDVVI